MIWRWHEKMHLVYLGSGMTKISHPPVQQDEITKSLSRAFEYSFDGVSEFTVPDMPDICGSFNIGHIVGASGSGKSTLLKRFGEELFPYWFDDKCIASHFDNEDEAMTLMGAVGLNSVPTWFRPYSILSVGEQYRADLSRRLVDNAVIDEFTSVVNRSVAKSCAHSVAKHIRKEDIQGVVFSSCHYDIAEWLEPDWIYDTATGELTYRGSLHRPTRRPEIKLDIMPCGLSTTQCELLPLYLLACQSLLLSHPDSLPRFSTTYSSKFFFPSFRNLLLYPLLILFATPLRER